MTNINAGSTFAEIIFLKSDQTSIIKREFNKVDSYFSYVGGLVGTIIGLFFIMSYYTERAYEVSIAKKLLVDNDGSELESRSFHVGNYFLTVIKDYLSLIGINPNWPQTQKYMDFTSEVCQQIDLAYIVRKLMFLDAATSKLLEKHEI